MTPREIELLTIAKLEHGGHQLSPAELRGIKAPAGRGPCNSQAVPRNDDQPRISLEQTSAAPCAVSST